MLKKQAIGHVKNVEVKRTPSSLATSSALSYFLSGSRPSSLSMSGIVSFFFACSIMSFLFAGKFILLSIF
jgi:hypothetical protein